MYSNWSSPPSLLSGNETLNERVGLGTGSKLSTTRTVLVHVANARCTPSHDYHMRVHIRGCMYTQKQ